ncbi:sodium/calcium exchanger 3-like isoform X1 [Thrips palmi]|uniref:Sodium/calcium exchanger 3-like isoform X1 n=1 Tax=Thrips palmi TaxID=161013 RepID=A0A6P8YQS9_THRPL|nr:sodium/calcium exchanger 3-like isoform X1 [Thrips palmi]
MGAMAVRVCVLVIVFLAGQGGQGQAAAYNASSNASGGPGGGHGGGHAMVEGTGPDGWVKCQPGLLLPVWRPDEGLGVGDRVARGFAYLCALLYLFLGVSIISDRFMAAIEVITSQEKEVVVKQKGKESKIVVVRVWNETVANLTLMALGSSAPEILLSIIEIWAKNFEAGDLGPGTIVGSAAYNLYVIIAICVFVIPEGEVRRIKHLRVFFVTALWSVFAYVWLYVILAVTSKGVVEVWEALLTFLFFPLTVGTAYIADRRLLFYKYLHKGYRINQHGMMVQAETGDVEMEKHVDGQMVDLEDEVEGDEAKAFEQNRREYIACLRELRKRHPTLELKALEQMAQEEVLTRGSKSRAFYRVQATRKMLGGSDVMRRYKGVHPSEMDPSGPATGPARPENQCARVFFKPSHYTVPESVGEFEVSVVREGDLAPTVLVDYRTEDGSAHAGCDYTGAQGTLRFTEGETVKKFSIAVIDDDEFEEDEHFYIRLYNLRLGPADDADGNDIRNNLGGSGSRVHAMPELVSPSTATVMILDDDHCGVFGFLDKAVELVESVGTFELKVKRFSGSRGKVLVPFRTVDGTARAGKEYEQQSGELVFENNETEKTITLHIIEEGCYEKDVDFQVSLGDPRILDEEDDAVPQVADDDSGSKLHRQQQQHMQRLQEQLHKAKQANGKPGGLDTSIIPDTPENRIALLGLPTLSDTFQVSVRIRESKEFKSTVDAMMQRGAGPILGTSTWKEQFVEAFSVAPDEDEEGGETASASCGDYVMHFFTFPWKFLFAFVPPTDYMHGWVAFTVSIVWIGFITAIIGDVSSHFGCSIGFKDTCTAFSLVAMGTSLPDTFASKVAALNDKYADASVGNVTGSNAVNVFLGIGIAWTLAALHHWWHGREFLVEPGNLAFNVTIFCVGAFVSILVMLLRRLKCVGGELGGPKVLKYLTTGLLMSLWFTYIILACLEAYGIMEGF